ncbi:bifunctional riboflavin kinase/FAD synthetase [Microbacterium sp. cx-55]|uniref:bifunctional riboflavin kinase/FAD synthetase n=1 Tax=unclassified Microbacterium TaxID=2609290 RepID=UPI001CBC3CD7|nr:MULTISPECIES: bifunctional riboflavin kinase/FAD synthetase [unclassified Microbacterium]MBZ4488558.1 bifunctional riboflavin kinase/FAD synthetase [Microbacterium sp. cx-55]MCC4909699.1 bifunctional riboflavin kinase/FAD synthetase [Microbacterium sp. cx-59]UGB36667.1 bifunctional riboflavin kinase/FAD synthetase [Microbacterium sp. cx-55]
MMVFRSPDDVPAGFGPSVVAIGKFDGVHAGHRAILERAKVDAATRGAKVVAVTFDRNPLALLRPDRCPTDLVSLPQKLRLLAETGIDATLVLTFDEQLSALAPRDFVVDTLVRPLAVSTVLVGADFRFGRGGAGTPDTLRELGDEFGFRVDVIDEVRGIHEGRRVSSTWVRELLAAGDVASASKLLGRPTSVWGEVVHGLKRGRELGFPTANLSPALEGFVPADGVYAGWLVDEAPGLRSGIRYPAAISVGTNPTFDDVAVRQVEAYVLDETDLDLYGHEVEVQFVRRVRGMVAFADIESLMVRMAEDVDEVRAILSRA